MCGSALFVIGKHGRLVSVKCPWGFWTLRLSLAIESSRMDDRKHHYSLNHVHLREVNLGEDECSGSVFRRQLGIGVCSSRHPHYQQNSVTNLDLNTDHHGRGPDSLQDSELSYGYDGGGNGALLCFGKCEGALCSAWQHRLGCKLKPSVPRLVWAR